MKVNYGKDLSGHKRKITVELSADDVNGLPETMRQQFVKSEVALVLGDPAQLVGMCARILGMRPTDPQEHLDLDMNDLLHPDE